MSLRDRFRRLLSRTEYRLGGWAWGPNVLLAAVAYIPLLLTRPGEVGADTKTYLYLDPERLLGDAVWMWDTGVGLGTVTHQNIGYLWPMGPWYWLFDTIGVPDWIAQRLWLGTLILAAGIGVRFMLRELRWVGPGATVAALAYALGPYLLHYGARISVILLPWAGLPWLIALAARSLRRGGWRHPAIFALVAMTVGGINFTSLALVMVGPILWFAYATFIEREVTPRRAIAVGSRITALTIITSLWWAAGLLIQGEFGIPILRYTETYEVVAKASTSTEILRGLGYWFFYGRDGLGPWIEGGIPMVESLPVLAVSFLLPLLALAAGVLTRFRNRVYFIALAAAGTVIAVGANPWDDPSPAGSLLKEWSRTDLGLAFRSTPRAVPLVSLAFSVFLAAGVSALARRFSGHRVLIAGIAMVLICVNQPGLFLGRMVDRHLIRDEQIPQYWEQAARSLDGGDHGTRVYEFPGTDFASYRWGNTVDPITPGLMDRDYAARELIPYGSPASADLLNALDAPLQEGRFEPSSLPPMLRLLGVGEAVFRADLQYERFRTPRPRSTFEMLDRLVAEGELGEPRGFGEPVRNRPVDELPLDDEIEFGTPPDLPDPHPVEVYDVRDPRPMVRTVNAGRPVILSGSGDGLVAYAGTGRLDPDRPILYSGSFAGDPESLRSTLRTTRADLVVTDTNRRRARRWGSVRENDGYTERTDESALVEDRADNRLELFENATDEHRTLAEQLPSPLEDGTDALGATVAASRYGNPVTLTAGDRAVFALDGDPRTAWKVAAFDEAVGHFLEVRLDGPVTTDHLSLLQRYPIGNRWITELGLRFDDEEEEFRVALDATSTEPPGQRLDLGGERTFSRVRLTVRATNLGRLARYRGVSEVGIAELGFGTDPPVRIREVVRPPVDLLGAAGPESLDHALTYLFHRRHAFAGDVTVADEEPAMLRWIQGPVPREYRVGGIVRLADQTRDHDIDRLIGWGGLPAGLPEARSSRRLPGAPHYRASMAFDGDPGTYWQSPVNFVEDQWIGVVTPAPHTRDVLRLNVVTDGRHSIPSRMRLEADGRIVAAWDVDLADGEGPDDRARVSLPFPTTTATEWRVVVEKVVPKTSTDWFSGDPTMLPVAIAEADLGVAVTPPGAGDAWVGDCRRDLLSIGGIPVPLIAEGTVDDLLSLRGLPVRACNGADAVAVDAGSVLLEAAPGTTTALHLDRLELESAPGGDAAPAAGPAPAPSGPEMRLDRPARLTYRASVSNAAEPFWLVLGQSHSLGWEARTADGTDLGPPTLINGYANGWLVEPALFGSDMTITVEWTPQRQVWIALGFSALGLLVCLWFALRPPRRLEGTRIPDGRVADMSVGGLSIWDRFGRSPAAHVVLALTAAVGATGWLLAGPVVGLVLAVAMALGVSTSWGWILVRIGCIGAFGAAAAYVVLKQGLNSYVLDFDWPRKFEDVHPLGLIAVGLLVIDGLIEARRGGWRRRAGVDL